MDERPIRPSARRSGKKTSRDVDEVSAPSLELHVSMDSGIVTWTSPHKSAAPAATTAYYPFVQIGVNAFVQHLLCPDGAQRTGEQKQTNSFLGDRRVETYPTDRSVPSDRIDTGTAEPGHTNPTRKRGTRPRPARDTAGPLACASGWYGHKRGSGSLFPAGRLTLATSH